MELINQLGIRYIHMIERKGKKTTIFFKYGIRQYQLGLDSNFGNIY